jgi:hypothetical protein
MVRDIPNLLSHSLSLNGFERGSSSSSSPLKREMTFATDSNGFILSLRKDLDENLLLARFKESASAAPIDFVKICGDIIDVATDLFHAQDVLITKKDIIRDAISKLENFEGWQQTEEDNQCSTLTEKIRKEFVNYFFTAKIYKVNRSNDREIDHYAEFWLRIRDVIENFESCPDQQPSETMYDADDEATISNVITVDHNNCNNCKQM